MTSEVKDDNEKIFYLLLNVTFDKLEVNCPCIWWCLAPLIDMMEAHMRAKLTECQKTAICHMEHLSCHWS